MSAWHIGLLANGVIGLAYVAISLTIFRGVHAHGLWRSNKLAVATGAIFLTCAAGHIAHLDHLVIGDAVAEARSAYDVHLAAVDTITALVGVAYWTLRRRFGQLLGTGEVFVDTGRRREEAAAIHDRVLQQLAAAKLALEFDRTDLARDAVDAGLQAAADLIADLDATPRSATPAAVRDGVS